MYGEQAEVCFPYYANRAHENVRKALGTSLRDGRCCCPTATPPTRVTPNSSAPPTPSAGAYAAQVFRGAGGRSRGRAGDAAAHRGTVRGLPRPGRDNELGFPRLSKTAVALQLEDCALARRGSLAHVVLISCYLDRSLQAARASWHLAQFNNELFNPLYFEKINCVS